MKDPANAQPLSKHGAREPSLSASTQSLDEGPRDRARHAPILYVALEAARPRAEPSRHVLEGIDEVQIGRGRERAALRLVEDGARILRLTIPDARMSTRHGRITRGAASLVFSDKNSKNGSRVDGVIAREHLLRDGDVLELGETFFVYRASVQVDDDAALDAGPSSSAPGLSTLKPDLARDFEALATIARGAPPVLLHGESGTGKELAARAVHELSGRRGRFVAVSCAAIPEALLEGELFGVKRGAFSGATEDREGLVAAADGGTLFLDEVGELSARAQTSLLRVLQEREVTALGGTRPRAVDFRVVSATHRDLAFDVESGRFRDDLRARLTGFAATLEPLRERREDLGLVLASLLERAGASADVKLTARAARALFAYEFPRNVRELEQALGAALALARGAPIDLEHFPRELAREREAAPSRAPEQPPLDDDAELRATLIRLLVEHRGNATRVGEAMGKKRQQIQKWCARLGIDLAAYR